jgi:hypothetical protein
VLPKTLTSWLTCLLLIALTALVLRVFVSAGRIEQGAVALSSDASTVILEARGAISDYRQTAEDNKKAITGTIELGAVANGSFRLINRQILPRVMKNLDSSDLLLATLNENAVTLNKTIANLDTRVSGKEGVLDAAIALIRGLESTAVTLGVTTRTAERMIQEIGTKSGMVLDEVWELAADPKLQQLLTNATITSGHIARTSEKVDATAEQVRLAMLNAPEIADSLNKITKASSKYAKITLLANLLLVLSRAFLP